MILVHFITGKESFLIKVENKRLVNLGIEAILDKYIKPLQNIQASFPNHNVEVQLELHASPGPLQDLRQPGRRFFKMKKPKTSYRRFNKEDDDKQLIKEPITPSQGVVKTIHSEKPTLPLSVSIISVSSTLPPVTSSLIMTSTATMSTPTIITTSNPKRIPVYMEDLHKAIYEIEKKISSSILPIHTTRCPRNHNAQVPPQIHHSDRQYSTPAIKNLEDILKLLKKGDHVETNVPKPTNDNLNWLQIRIPKHV
ncbi:hypothetical protein K1T71_009709 [Dendrolimus kikuchii]|uniref:Uncharacterized protein n=1 Tax=Dendrolimus kikuchii TaxID=765133 RepID=A0ACC1CSH5_9NEOP|nr:hypothetical protein K1T71_009709 [Dendrolimus kikuchii]